MGKCQKSMHCYLQTAEISSSTQLSAREREIERVQSAIGNRAIESNHAAELEKWGEKQHWDRQGMEKMLQRPEEKLHADVINRSKGCKGERLG